MDGFQLLNDRILVQPNARNEDMIRNGIIIPKSVRYSSLTGTAVAVGPGRRNDDGTYSPMMVCKGDTVHYVLGAGIDVLLSGEHYIVIPEVEIIAVDNTNQTES